MLKSSLLRNVIPQGEEKAVWFAFSVTSFQHQSKEQYADAREDGEETQTAVEQAVSHGFCSRLETELLLVELLLR